MSVSEANPSTFLGIGTWEKLSAGYALWTATSGAGGTIAAGLPNLIGHFGCGGYGGFSAFSWANGVFKLDTEQWSEYQASTHKNEPQSDKYKGITMDASQVGGSVYGKSTTVQPPAIKIYAWKRVS